MNLSCAGALKHMAVNPIAPQPVDNDPDDLPRLAAALTRLQARSARTPHEIDDSMRLEIRAHFDAIKRAGGAERIAGRRWRIGAAAVALAGGVAALIALAMWLNTPPTPQSNSPMAQAPTPSAPGDIDGSGRIDILDAFQLARRIEAAETFEEPSTRIFDLTGDGSVDQRDVDAVAMRAVTLTSPTTPEARGRSS